jgi:dCMP deaminase
MLSRKDLQFMELCVQHATIFSTCSKKKYSAVLVDEFGHVVGIGYNGGPKNFTHCSDGGCPRALVNSESGSMYDNCIATHAEQNAFLHSDYSSKPIKLYVNGPPCFTCAKLIANSTVTKLYYMHDDSYNDWVNIKAFLNKAGVETIMVS